VAASWRLLEPDERVCLQWLAAFRWRWSMELAEALLTDVPLAGDVVAVVDRLVSLGLISARLGGHEYRFRLLDVVRDFVLERAAESGLLRLGRDRHAVVMSAVAARAAVEIAGPAPDAAMERLDYLASDLRAALSHYRDPDPAAALRLAVSLIGWWRLRGRELEGREVLHQLLADPRSADALDPEMLAHIASI